MDNIVADSDEIISLSHLRDVTTYLAYVTWPMTRQQDLTLNGSAFCQQSIYVLLVILQKAAIVSLYSIIYTIFALQRVNVLPTQHRQRALHLCAPPFHTVLTTPPSCAGAMPTCWVLANMPWRRMAALKYTAMALYPPGEKVYGNHWNGEWLDHRPGLYAVGKRNLLLLLRNETDSSVVQSVIWSIHIVAI
jgi:hypothetical protein